MKSAIWAATIGVAMVMAAPSLGQEAFPNKPVRLIVPNPPGGSTDVVARIVAEHASLAGQQIVVENVPGASGMIGLETAKNAPADGYTIVMATTGLTSSPFLMEAFTLDPVADFTPITALTLSSGLLMSVHESVPANSLEELIAYSKANPDALNFGSPGGTPNLDMPLVQLGTGLELTTIPYQGQAAVLQAIASGEVQLIMDPPWSSKPMLDSGTIKPIVVGTPERIPLVPDVPTFAESGFEDVSVTTTWFGVVGPKGLPQDIVDTLASALASALENETVLERLGTMGMRPAPATGPEALTEIILNDQIRFAEGARIGGIVPQ